jgi:hypothetical protein
LTELLLAEAEKEDAGIPLENRISLVTLLKIMGLEKTACFYHLQANDNEFQKKKTDETLDCCSAWPPRHGESSSMQTAVSETFDNYSARLT